MKLVFVNSNSEFNFCRSLSKVDCKSYIYCLFWSILVWSWETLASYNSFISLMWLKLSSAFCCNNYSREDKVDLSWLESTVFSSNYAFIKLFSFVLSSSCLAAFWSYICRLDLIESIILLDSSLDFEVEFVGWDFYVWDGLAS